MNNYTIESKAIHNFIELLDTNYDFGNDKDGLFNLWKEKYYPNYNPLDIKPTFSELKKLKKADLVALCEEKSLPINGKKDILISRILGIKIEEKPKTQKKAKKSKPISEIFLKINENQNTIDIRRNIFGNYEHQDSKFVFDTVSKQVIGKQNSNGNIDVLKSEDILTCKEYKFDYILPINLDVD